MPSSQVTDYRALRQRIERFIEVLERWPRNPDRWECEYALQAVRSLEELDFMRGNHSIMWAEWPIERRTPQMVAAFKPEFALLATQGLRARIDRLLRNMPS
ncbi:MAG: hypothetical protein WCK95_20960 [Alphaproteobacteria bacterium]|jgi:hypothetical protein